MITLIRFLVKYQSFLLFFALEIVCIFCIVQNSRYHRAGFINSVNGVTGGINAQFADVSQFMRLGETNQALAEENARLRALLESSGYEKDVFDAKQVEVLDDGRIQTFTYLPAEVIRNSTMNASNYIMLNRGALDGITKEMGVIGDEGIVGVVVEVADHYALVMSVLHKSSRVSAKLDRLGYFGSLRWEGMNATRMILENVPRHVGVVKGDPIVTSGFSQFFPADHPIGHVLEYQVSEGTNFLEIEIELSQNMQNLDYVYVVKNLMKQETVQLEAAEDE